MNKTGKVLIIDDDEDILSAGRLLLKQHLAFVETTPNPDRIPALLGAESYDVILLDMNFAKGATAGQEGFAWLRKILDLDPAAVVVLITAYGDVDLAVRAVKEGASDFVLKPWQNEKLLATLNAALSLRRSRDEALALQGRQHVLSADLDQPFRDVIGDSPAMEAVFTLVRKVAATEANVLILGENGTGKELVAREIHRRSPRAGEAFIAVDMSALPETLFESELFGHVKGAFTDARDSRAGRFEAAGGGTLFLDEIGNLSLPLQAKILTVLESRQVFRVGSNKPTPIDIRLISATNMPLTEMVAQHRFRQDLLYRVNTVEIRLPPLRQRAGDIRLLVEYYLGQFGRKYQKPGLAVSPAAFDRLRAYSWPGNVRELQHAVERAVIMGESRVLEPKDFFFGSEAEVPPPGAAGDLNIENMERLLVEGAIRKHQGNISRAANALGLSRAALYRRMAKHGL
ncbi:MAG TPA: sigma-54 dependent transcriptional regulator [Candidatus Aminicenantes bacterium]|nr:sigma-54 dependent transcriptional regulator [Candidatus Aminicenantes bacterium]HRY65165.1 sigma-54 dependent transcriptional regulator [Candidatus Aminicenantes bacterium]HRZ72367.1 sigma-54 dependent transcriptional regulator [Candidatus Aminicenantes bacterium]